METWYAAVRHTGALFGLPLPDEGVSSSDLPYPQLLESISNAQLAPGVSITEHYNRPGGVHLYCSLLLLATCPTADIIRAAGFAGGATRCNPERVHPLIIK